MERQPQFVAIWHWPSTSRGRRRIAICVGILLLSGLAAYGAAYLSVMHVLKIGTGNARGITWGAVPRYRVPAVFPQALGLYADDFFMPANQIDRLIRPGLWKGRWEKVTLDHFEERKSSEKQK